MEFVEIESRGHEAQPMLTERHYRNFCVICQHQVTMMDNGKWVHDDR